MGSEMCIRDRLLIDEVGAMVPKSERTGVQKLVDGRKLRHCGQQILFNFSKVRCGIQSDNPGDLAQMKRGFCTRLKGSKNMASHQRWKGASCVSFYLQTEVVKHGGPGVPLPRKGSAELKQFGVKTLKTTGFREGPRADTWRVKKREFSVFGCSNASSMKGHERARLVIEEHR